VEAQERGDDGASAEEQEEGRLVPLAHLKRVFQKFLDSVYGCYDF
jgi:hypothetical protein